MAKEMPEVRPTTPRTFLGFRVELAAVPEKRVRELLGHAWRTRAPKRLLAQYDG
jgi:hypothetical protein